MVAVVLGGGVGTRFGAGLPKQLLTLAGKTLVEHCVGAFAEAPGIDETVLVMPANYHQEARRIVGDQVSVIIEGGATRSDSVRNALAYLAARYPEAETGVLFHDAARPLVTQQIIADCAEALEKQGYAIERRKIALEEPIKTLGEFKVPLRLHKDVTAELTVVVLKEE